MPIIDTSAAHQLPTQSTQSRFAHSDVRHFFHVVPRCKKRDGSGVRKCGKMALFVAKMALFAISAREAGKGWEESQVKVARAVAEEAFLNSFRFFTISWKITQNLFLHDSRGVKKKIQCKAVRRIKGNNGNRLQLLWMGFQKVTCGEKFSLSPLSLV